MLRTVQLTVHATAGNYLPGCLWSTAMYTRRAHRVCSEHSTSPARLHLNAVLACRAFTCVMAHPHDVVIPVVLQASRPEQPRQTQLRVYAHRLLNLGGLARVRCLSRVLRWDSQLAGCGVLGLSGGGARSVSAVAFTAHNRAHCTRHTAHQAARCTTHTREKVAWQGRTAE